jgi:hypothetical protein
MIVIFDSTLLRTWTWDPDFKFLHPSIMNCPKVFNLLINYWSFVKPFIPFFFSFSFLNSGLPTGYKINSTSKKKQKRNGSVQIILGSSPLNIVLGVLQQGPQFSARPKYCSNYKKRERLLKSKHIMCYWDVTWDTC